MASLVTFAKKLWKDKAGGNTPITAAELNRMEDGINNCATQINKLGDSVSPLPFRGTLNGAYDDTPAAWRKRPSGIYWLQPSTSSKVGFVLHMRREDQKAEADIASSNVTQFFNSTYDSKIQCRSVSWGKDDFGSWA